jgi:deferrochelatase/peroxidase EfeB
MDQSSPRTPLLRTPHPRLNDVVLADGKPDYPGEVQLEKPKVAVNAAFTFDGLLALDVPTRTLRGMPDEFIDGMEKRAAMLGDLDFLSRRDPIWQRTDEKHRVHIWVSMNAEMTPAGEPVPELEQETSWLRSLCARSEGGVTILRGAAPPDADFQDASAVLQADGEHVQATNKEHFGLSDGFGDPVFEGQLNDAFERVKVVGGGKILPDRTWAPLATGEFLLGYPDEAQEIAGAAMPIEFSRNGTFMAYRKLHENVGAFDRYMSDQGRRYAQVFTIAEEEARQTVQAKLVGRWADGVPLMAAPTYRDWEAFNVKMSAARAAKDTQTLQEIAQQFVNFTYRGDPAGATCPVSSHLRRMNTRDMLDPHFTSKNPKEWQGSALNNRRRILRRGLPYGDAPEPFDDAGEHGIVFMAVCASLFRQFEFVQQQWVHYGLDFNVGSDTCPIVGNHNSDGMGPEAKFLIPTDPSGTGIPYICECVPQFVEPRGGDYFFVPSMTALRMIGMGIVDPT